MANIYKRFGENSSISDLDFSDDALYKMYEYESKGIGNCGKLDIFNDSKLNGYAYGKRIMDITISMWKESLNGPHGFYYLNEIKNDSFPRWFLDKVLN